MSFSTIKDAEEIPYQSGVYEHHCLKASKGQHSIRLDKFVSNFIEDVTRNKIQQAAKNGNILVNGNPQKQNYKVKPCDEIKIVFEYPPHEFLLEPEDIPINIVYEDVYILVVNKVANMVVHPGHGNYSGTLINAVLHHFQTQSSTKIPLNKDNRPGLVHRIDKGTTGLLVLAKTETAMSYLARQFFQKTTQREYIALVWGYVEQDKGTIVGNIGRHPKNRLQMTVFEEESLGREAITHYQVIERIGYVTLISCRLETGRTHQIRVHLKHIGHTLFGDERYGGDQILKGPIHSKYRQFVTNCLKNLSRPALHARTLGFVHPKTREHVNYECPIPEDMQQCIERWRNYRKSSISRK